MPDFVFGGPVFGDTGPVPVVKNALRAISPSDRPVPDTTTDQLSPITGLAGAAEAARLAAEQQLAAARARERARAQLNPLQIPVQFADP